MTIVPMKGGGSDIEEPDWLRLIPDSATDDGLVSMAPWRDFAHRQWLRVCAELRGMETLAATNAHQIQRLVVAYVRYDLAAAKMMSVSPVLASPKTGTPMVNLWQVEMRAADSDATTAEMELCLNPRRRASAGKVKKQARAASSADRFVGAAKA